MVMFLIFPCWEDFWMKISVHVCVSFVQTAVGEITSCPKLRRNCGAHSYRQNLLGKTAGFSCSIRAILNLPKLPFVPPMLSRKINGRLVLFFHHNTSFYLCFLAFFREGDGGWCLLLSPVSFFLPYFFSQFFLSFFLSTFFRTFSLFSSSFFPSITIMSL